MGQILLFATGLLVLTVISVGSIYLVNRVLEDNAGVVHTIEAENQVNALLLDVRRAESSARGYLLTHDPEFLADHETAVAAIMPALDRLAHLVRDNPAQIESVTQLYTAIGNRLDQFTQEIDLARQGNPSSAATLACEAAARDTTDKIRDISIGMLHKEELLSRERGRNADRNQMLAASTTGIGSGLVVLLACLSIWLVRRSASARDQAETLLRDTNLNLEATVDKRTADLREANNEIQRFAYIVSHDLRSPLVNVMGFASELEQLGDDIFRRIASLAQAPSDGSPLADTAELALAPADRRLSNDFSDALGFIKSSINKMDRLISAILDLTREGRREFQPIQIDTYELIEAVVETLTHQASEAGAQIRIGPLPNITSDHLALEQIFSNLIDNAIKYLRPGVRGEISVHGRTKLGYAIFEISDNGRGIDPKDHQRIFDMFRRAGTQERPGQGIGLANVRALVRRLGGTISVSSELNIGSTFTVTLPMNWNAGSALPSS